MNKTEIKNKAHRLISDLIDSAIIAGWEFGENEEDSILIEKEMRNIEKDLRQKSRFNYKEWKNG